MRPMPGQLNTCSTITAPPSRNGILALTISVTGIRKPSLNAWRHTGARQLRKHRQPGADRVAEIALQHLAEPRRVLAVPGARHAERLAHAEGELGARRLALEQDVERVARGEVEDGEHHRAHAEQQERGHGQLAREDAADRPDRSELHITSARWPE